MKRARGRPPGGHRWLVVQTMLGVLAPRPGRPSIAESYKGKWKVAYAAGIAAKRCRLKPNTCERYYNEYINAGGETPEQLARREYGDLLGAVAADPYPADQARRMNAEAARGLSLPIREKKTRN